MPINNITQTISTIPKAGRRGVDVQTQFVIKQEDFQDHLQGTTVTELNTLKDQLNSRIGEINSTTTTMNGYVNDAFVGSSTATTKAGEASTSATAALNSKNQASTFATNSSNSATKSSQWADNNYNVAVEAGKYSAKHWATVAENTVNTTVKLTGNQTVAGIKTFTSSPIVPTPTANTQATNKAYADLKVALTDFTGANVSLTTSGFQKLPSGLIIQWGVGFAGSNGTSYTNNFPIAFPTGCVSVTANHEGGADMNIVITQSLVLPTSFGAISWYSSSNIPIRWIAIGY